MDNKFSYTYTAPTEQERAEIESIRRDYSPEGRKQTDLEKLRALDKKVKNLPMVLSLTIGIIGTLIFGLGICMALEWNLLLWGIVVGIIGCIPVGLAYPCYKWILARQKKKYGNEIIALSDKLLNESKSE